MKKYFHVRYTNPPAQRCQAISVRRPGSGAGWGHRRETRSSPMIPLRGLQAEGVEMGRLSRPRLSSATGLRSSCSLRLRGHCELPPQLPERHLFPLAATPTVGHRETVKRCAFTVRKNKWARAGSGALRDAAVNVQVRPTLAGQEEGQQYPEGGGHRSLHHLGSDFKRHHAHPPPGPALRTAAEPSRNHKGRPGATLLRRRTGTLCCCGIFGYAVEAT
jgi:hypothetical protein